MSSTNEVAELKEALRENIVSVLFEKKDGTERSMRCTLNSIVIPEDKRPKGTDERVANDSVLPVFDIDIMEWRSFRLSSLKYWGVYVKS